ncbi:restriction endonuclease subunit S [Clostridium gasigenes]|uniref:Type I restriction modification DNA specificity domain-containing protein n=1 Tax=Clostridium gasigenes TaxID=94869 RepID=A0A1H0V516_9CLOT|nr:restriction endonuclease subunit S [Clostridium gasigenes]SDP73268.1 Type I restriction modification DNA specificity domain-containing protein [Clostridium gasigenes]
MAKLSDLFDIQYGNNFILTSLTQLDNGISFVSRTSKNSGVSAIVKPVPNIKPFPSGLITVALSSMSVLETNIQSYEFYTGYHIAVLTPKKEMSINEKVYYCLCIKCNKYRYYFGRQANRTLGELIVPNTPPKWISEFSTSSYNDIALPYNDNLSVILNTDKWNNFKINELFKITTGKGPLIRKAKSDIGTTPLVSSTQFKNGIVAYTNCDYTHDGNVLTLAKNGSVGEIFYQPIDFVATSDVLVLEPKFTLDIYIAMFLIPIIKQEKHRYNYGRKWNKEPLEQSLIKLPITIDNKPDWNYMRDYIKTLKFSKYIQSK